MKSCNCYALRAIDCTCLPEKYDEIYTTPDPEPVAWLHTKIEGVVVPHRPADLDKHPDRWEALYKTPPPCPTCEALARTVMLEQTSHDTTPPAQRQWVGLTPADFDWLKQMFANKITNDFVFADIVCSIENKLKEKNT